jgi:hypothetical protein
MQYTSIITDMEMRATKAVPICTFTNISASYVPLMKLKPFARIWDWGVQPALVHAATHQ